VNAGGSRLLRENAFLVAAVSLPLLVVALFLVATAIPRWFVAPPAYDLVLKTPGSYNGLPRAQLAVEIAVREGRAEATIQRVAGNPPPPIPRLFLFDHETLTARELSVDVPSPAEGDEQVAVPIRELAGRRLLAGPRSPDGYEFETGQRRGAGIVGELFGMNRYPRLSLAKDGRTVPITLPSNEHWYGVTAVGWIVEDGAR
jgi:hypothetical protein